MNVHGLSRRLRLPVWFAIAVMALLFCLLFTNQTYAEQPKLPGCDVDSHSLVTYETKELYCLPVEQVEKTIDEIDAFAENRSVPINAIQLLEGDARDIHYLESPQSDVKKTLIAIPEAAIDQKAVILSKLQIGIQRYRRRTFGCTLTNQTVSIGTQPGSYSEPIFCVRTGLLNRNFANRAERIERQIGRIEAGEINIETLEIVPLSELRVSMGIPQYADLEGDEDNIEEQSMAIVSRSPSLKKRDQIVLIVTALDAALYSQAEADTKSPYELASIYLDRITRASNYAYAQGVGQVTFNMHPFFWAYAHKNNTDTNPEDNIQSQLVELFSVSDVGAYYNTFFRATQISKNIDDFANYFNVFYFPRLFTPVESLSIEGDEKAGFRIVYPQGNGSDEDGHIVIMTINPEDTNLLDSSGEGTHESASEDTAETLLSEIETVVRSYRTAYYQVLYTTVFLLVIVPLLIWLFLKIWSSSPASTHHANSPAIVSRKFLMLIADVAILLVACYYIPFVRRWSPVQAFGDTVTAFWEYTFSDLPTLLSIVVFGLLASWLVQWLPFNLILPRRKALSSSKRKASISILRFVIFAVTCVLASPHFPGAGTIYLAGISGFVALAFSLSASAAIGDIIAGLVLIYFSQINEGSWIQIGDIRGKVITQNLFVHRIKTSKNEVLTIPNVRVLNGTITDYSEASAGNHGPLVLHTTVTLGYHVPWQQVYQLLIEAAIAVNDDPIWDVERPPIRQDKAPFVLQLSLDDFYVTYQLNAYTDRIDGLALIYSKLHENIQTKLHSAGIEILSPHYAAERDPSHPILPPRVFSGASSEQEGNSAPL